MKTKKNTIINICQGDFIVQLVGAFGFCTVRSLTLVLPFSPVHQDKRIKFLKLKYEKLKKEEL